MYDNILEEQILDCKQKKLINDFMNTDNINYKYSYDLLMPVLEQIESLGYRWEIGMSTTSTYHYCKIWSIGIIEGISLVDAIYGVVVEFIMWYNITHELADNQRDATKNFISKKYECIPCTTIDECT